MIFSILVSLAAMYVGPMIYSILVSLAAMYVGPMIYSILVSLSAMNVSPMIYSILVSLSAMYAGPLIYLFGSKDFAGYVELIKESGAVGTGLVGLTKFSLSFCFSYHLWAGMRHLVSLKLLFCFQ